MGIDSGEVLKSASRDPDDQHILWDFDPNVFQWSLAAAFSCKVWWVRSHD